MLIYMLNMLNYANYALCSDCVIMPKSNAGIIGLAQPSCRLGAVRTGAPSERSDDAGGGGLHLLGCQDDERDEEGLHGLVVRSL